MAVALVLVCGLGAASAQAGCARDGDWLVCDDGRRYAIRLDADVGSRRWQAWPGGRTEGGWGPFPSDGAPSFVTDGGVPLQGPDGLVCWPHGDHVHCR